MTALAERPVIEQVPDPLTDDIEIISSPAEFDQLRLTTADGREISGEQLMAGVQENADGARKHVWAAALAGGGMTSTEAQAAFVAEVPYMRHRDVEKVDSIIREEQTHYDAIDDAAGAISAVLQMHAPKIDEAKRKNTGIVEDDPETLELMYETERNLWRAAKNGYRSDEAKAALRVALSILPADKITKYYSSALGIDKASETLWYTLAENRPDSQEVQAALVAAQNVLPQADIEKFILHVEYLLGVHDSPTEPSPLYMKRCGEISLAQSIAVSDRREAAIVRKRMRRALLAVAAASATVAVAITNPGHFENVFKTEVQHSQPYAGNDQSIYGIDGSQSGPAIHSDHNHQVRHGRHGHHPFRHVVHRFRRKLGGRI